METGKIDAKDILVRAQETPNPYALKFVANVPFKSKGKATIVDREECLHLPLLRDLMDLSSVKQVYVFQNQLTLTHDGGIHQDQFIADVESIVRSRYAAHDVDFETEEEMKTVIKKDRSNLSPELLEIEKILDRTIRPGLQADGGDVEVIEYKDNQLKIMYQGACGGCPSAMMGTLDAIRGILQQELKNPELMVYPI